jgi:hypothetical protein
MADVKTRDVVWLSPKPLSTRFGQSVQMGQRVTLTETQISAFRDCLGDQADPRTAAAIAAASTGAAAQTVYEEAAGGRIVRQGPETIRVAGIEPNKESGRTEEQPVYHHLEPEAVGPIGGPDLPEDEKGLNVLNIEGEPGEFTQEALKKQQEEAKKAEGEPSSQPRQEQRAGVARSPAEAAALPGPTPQSTVKSPARKD